MNLIETSLLLKNLTYLSCYLPELWGGGVGQILTSLHRACTAYEWPGCVWCVPQAHTGPLATSALCCRSVEVSLLPYDHHIKSCRLYCSTRFLCLVDWGKKVGREMKGSTFVRYILLSHFHPVNQQISGHAGLEVLTRVCISLASPI